MERLREILTPMDMAAIIAYFAIALGIGLLFARRGSKSIDEFFCSGRSAPWWLLGVSMVATTFAADTPLAVTGMVAQNGIAGNWLWWNMVMSGMLTTFFFARLWRRSEVMTDVELAELRYGGTPAKILRIFRALYLAFPINCVVIGWVTVAMLKVIKVTLGCDEDTAWNIIYILYAITCIYVSLSGLWGVMATDFIQFFVAMGGSIMLAVFALREVGGVDQLKEALLTNEKLGPDFLNMLPALDSAKGVGSFVLMGFLVMIAVQWWAAWYPGAEPGGGGYIAQRMFSAKNERHSILAILFFNVAHYALRPWPWIIVALCSLVLYPNIAGSDGVVDPELGYPKAMIELLPPGLLGVMLVAFLAAFMSTISTQVNWGSSYVVNDVYKRFIVKEGSNSHYVWVSRFVTLATILIGLLVSQQFKSVKGAWEFILAMGAGTGLVLILRWYWWRINAWSEIVAMIASLVVAGSLHVWFKHNNDLMMTTFGEDVYKQYIFAITMLVVVSVTTIAWIVATFVTRPESKETLEKFYRKARPGGPGWSRLRTVAPDVKADRGLLVDAGCFLLGTASIYSALFGVGQMIFGNRMMGAGLCLGSLVGIFILVMVISSRTREQEIPAEE